MFFSGIDSVVAAGEAGEGSLLVRIIRDAKLAGVPHFKFETGPNKIWHGQTAVRTYWLSNRECHTSLDSDYM